MKDREFIIWMLWNFPYAMHRNPDCIYSQDDYNSVKKAFKNQPQEDKIYKAIACLLVSVRRLRKEIQGRDVSTLRDQCLNTIPKEFHYVIDDPAPLCRKLKRIINGQTNEEFEKETQQEVSRCVNQLLERHGSIKLSDKDAESEEKSEKYIGEKNKCIRDVLKLLFPEITFKASEIRDMINRAKENMDSYLDGEEAKARILIECCDNDGLKSLFWKYFYNVDKPHRLYDFYKDTYPLDNLLQASITELSKKPSEFIIQKRLEEKLYSYIVGIADKLLRKYSNRKERKEDGGYENYNTSSTKDSEDDFDGDPYGYTIECNKNFDHPENFLIQKESFNKIKAGLSPDEYRMFMAYTESQDFSKAARKLENEFSRYLIEQAYKKALKILGY